MQNENKIEQAVREVETVKEIELNEFKEKHDEEVRKLTDEIAKLNQKIIESKQDTRYRPTSSALVHATIENKKLMDSARTSRTKDSNSELTNLLISQSKINHGRHASTSAGYVLSSKYFDFSLY